MKYLGFPVEAIYLHNVYSNLHDFLMIPNKSFTLIILLVFKLDNELELR